MLVEALATNQIPRQSPQRRTRTVVRERCTSAAAPTAESDARIAVREAYRRHWKWACGRHAADFGEFVDDGHEYGGGVYGYFLGLGDAAEVEGCGGVCVGYVVGAGFKGLD